jgi:hypothetical protein
MSITDEILNLEPIEDKLVYLKRNYEMSIFQISNLLKLRLSFFAIYNLFDAVYANYIDN